MKHAFLLIRILIFFIIGCGYPYACIAQSGLTRENTFSSIDTSKNAESILILNSYYLDFTLANSIQDEIIYSYFKQVHLFVEVENVAHLQEMAYDDAVDEFSNIYEKYTKKPKVVVVLGNLAWQFYRSTVPSAWEDVQVIIALARDCYLDYKTYAEGSCPINDVPKHSLQASCQGINTQIIPHHITVNKTIRLMKQLMPDMKKVVFVIGKDYNSQNIKELIRYQLKSLNLVDVDIQMIDQSETTTEDLVQSLNTLDSKCGTIFISWHFFDDNGRFNSDSFIHYKYLTSQTTIPPFLINDLYFSEGLFFGGYFPDRKYLGATIVSSINSILHQGHPTPGIDVLNLDNNNTLYLNYQHLQKLQIDIPSVIHDLSPVFINRDVSFFVRYKNELIVGFLFIVLLLLLFRYFFVSRDRIKLQIEKELKIEKELADLYDNMPILFARIHLLYDPQGEVNDIELVHENKAFVQLFFTDARTNCNFDSIKEEQLMNKKGKALLKQVDTHHEKYNTTMYIPTMERTYNVSMVSAPVDGEIDIFLSDSTDLVNAQKKATEVKDRILSHYKDLPIAIGTFNVDFTPFDCNKNFAAIFGINIEEFVQKIPALDQTPLFSSHEIEQIKSGSFPSQEKVITAQIVRKMGGKIRSKSPRTFLFQIRSLTLDNIHTDGYILMLIDHSALQEIERISNINNKTLVGILNNLPFAVAIKDVDDDFKHVYWNKKYAQMYSIPELELGPTLNSNTFKESLNTINNQDSQLANGIQKSIVTEIRINNRILVKRKNLIVGKDEHRWILISLIDVTDQREQEQRSRHEAEVAQKSNELKSAFIANMSHEIRTPLNAIVGFSEVLVETESKEEREVYARHIETNNAILLQLIGDILDLSKIEAHVIDFHFVDCDLVELLHNVEMQARMNIPTTNVQFSTKCNKSSCFVHIERTRTTQVLTNLINNAIKFTKQGFIRLECEIPEEKGDIRFAVSDSGCGISPEKLDSIFQRFVKLDNFVPGSGLGLSICKSLVEQLGGEIGVNSKVDEGATFWFTLPFVPARSSKAILPEEKPMTNKTFTLRRNAVLLIAEDMKSNYDLLVTILSNKYTLVRACNGIEAVEMFHKRKPDLILMDILMPLMDGYEATALIRKEDSVIPIVALTAYAQEQDKEHILQSGFTDYLSKPLTKRTLIQTIERLLQLAHGR